MIPLKASLIGLASIVGAFLLLWGYKAYASNHEAEVRAWKARAEAAHDSVVVANRNALLADTIYKQGETVYIRGRDRILASPGGKTPEVKACFALSDTLNTLCAQRHVADTAALHATERELNVWKNKPGEPRVQVFGEGMYDIAHQVPVIRGGVTAKVFGPIYLSAAAEYAAPQKGSSNPAFRGLVGARINF